MKNYELKKSVDGDTERVTVFMIEDRKDQPRSEKKASSNKLKENK